MLHFHLQTGTNFSCTPIEVNNNFSRRQNKGLRDAKNTIFPIQWNFSKGMLCQLFFNAKLSFDNH